MNDFAANKRNVLAEIDKRLESKLAVIGEIVAGNAKANCPVDTGRLKSAISWVTSNGDSGGFESKIASDKISRPIKKSSVKIGTNVEYAIYVELGTYGQQVKAGVRRLVSAQKGGMKRKAMLRNALYKNRNEIKRILAL